MHIFVNLYRYQSQLTKIQFALTSITAITEQHFLWICLAPADAALGVHDGLGPDDRVVEGGEVEEQLTHVAARHQARLPPLERCHCRFLEKEQLN
jgi:hypothetical protein